jgi:hypothetical protein
MADSKPRQGLDSTQPFNADRADQADFSDRIRFIRLIRPIRVQKNTDHFYNFGFSDTPYLINSIGTPGMIRTSDHLLVRSLLKAFLIDRGGLHCGVRAWWWTCDRSRLTILTTQEKQGK